MARRTRSMGMIDHPPFSCRRDSITAVSSPEKPAVNWVVGAVHSKARRRPKHVIKDNDFHLLLRNQRREPFDSRTVEVLLQELENERSTKEQKPKPRKRSTKATTSRPCITKRSNLMNRWNVRGHTTTTATNPSVGAESEEQSAEDITEKTEQNAANEHIPQVELQDPVQSETSGETDYITIALSDKGQAHGPPIRVRIRPSNLHNELVRNLRSAGSSETGEPIRKPKHAPEKHVKLLLPGLRRAKATEEMETDGVVTRARARPNESSHSIVLPSSSASSTSHSNRNRKIRLTPSPPERLSNFDDHQLFVECGHTSSSYDSSLNNLDNVWTQLEDDEGDLNFNDVLMEFRVSVYCLALIHKHKGMLKHLYESLEIFEWSHHLSSSLNRKGQLRVRSFKNKDFFPWDVYELPLYQEFQFSSRANLQRLLFSKRKTVQNFASFTAAVLWRYYPHCCTFSYVQKSFSSQKSSKPNSPNLPFVRLRAVCNVPECQLSVSLIIPDLPADKRTPVKFVLFVNHNRSYAFRAPSFMPLKPVNMAQKIGEHCPHCMVNEHVSKVTPRTTLATVRRFAKPIKQPCLEIDHHVAVWDLFNYVTSMYEPSPLRRLYDSKPLTVEQTQIHVIVGTDSLKKKQLPKRLDAAAGDLFLNRRVCAKNRTVIKMVVEHAFELKLINRDEELLLINCLKKDVSYMHLLPALQQGLRKTNCP